ncbi:hypothetical protein HV560_03950 [Mannheimia pernigra]|uniref:Uncharacterized protein n=1 Tax=Mannheimia pernigra TaxID=111844 RepID=A0ABD7A7D4_9PAST|nr:hypothetical protein [Mannheimia pernigra]QLB42033.1 hypothetical protein HV560_03950 [Mannheimia pernigra]
MPTLFDECREVLSEYFTLLSLEEEELVLNEFNKYPFKYGSIENDMNIVESIDFFSFLKLISKKELNEDVCILSDTKGIPFFKTKLLLALDNIDDISALSKNVFFLGDGYLAQVVDKNPPISIFRLKQKN